jgi:hypothetical protein
LDGKLADGKIVKVIRTVFMNMYLFFGRGRGYDETMEVKVLYINTFVYYIRI